MNSLVRTLTYTVLALAAGMVTHVSVAASSDERTRHRAEAVAQEAQRRQREVRLRWEYERRRSAAHTRMPNTLYASTPSAQAHAELSCPVLVDEDTPHIYRGFLEGQGGSPRVVSAPGLSRSRASSKRSGSGLTVVSAQGAAAKHNSPWSSTSRHNDKSLNPLVQASARQSASYRPTSAMEDSQHAYLFPSASEPLRQGFVRVINHSDESGEVSIDPVDDGGRAFDTITLSIDANETMHFNSDDLEMGNAGKGLTGNTGSGEGDWRLAFSSSLDIEVLSYIRTEDGFLTAMHDVAPPDGDVHRVAIFNPEINKNQVSRLRLINPGEEIAKITIRGTDDNGMAGTGEVSISLDAGVSREITAAQLELGDDEFDGMLGDGSGKWRLEVDSEQAIVAMSLLESPTDHLTNLSTVPVIPEDGMHRVPLFPAAGDASGRQGFVRVINGSDTSGEVRIEAYDETERDYEPLTLSIGANEVVHFNSDHLEQGSPSKGLSGGVGAGEGGWRLELTSDLDVEVLSYIRTEDGFLTAMHDVAASAGNRHRVAVFNPGSNRNQESLLTLINRGDEVTQVIIYGIDDKGAPGGGGVSLTLTAGESRTLGAWELESGSDGLTGKLGDGSGKWQLMLTADRPVVAMSLLRSPTGHLTNLSTAPARGARSGARLEGIALTAQEVFEQLISGPIVQSKCINCHVEGGASGNTRLVFVSETESGHEAANLQVFRDFLDEVEDGASYLLNKVQGALGHGGGIQVARGTEDYANLERFLVLLGGRVDSVLVTPENLFDGVTMETPRNTLRRAAVIFAGRHPTAAEYASAGAGDLGRLRAAVRGLMDGPPFREFLVRGANDRLLTDRDWLVVDPNDGYLTAHANRYFELRTVDEPFAWQRWAFGAQYGFRRAPLELIAHVVTNDLPYTEILTADYVMANPMSAEGYGAQTAFDDPDDAHEFRPSEVATYYLQGDGYDVQCEQGNCVHSAPESLRADYPHAGVLNTKVFLQRYPTTPTNRNRARSRWTYYHFLGLDIEKSASRTTDPVALADTDNPTQYNPACTVCHSVLDPVAGAFQNYGDVGFYKDEYGGMDSLDEFYKYSPPGGTMVSVSARTPEDEPSRLGPLRLVTGRGNEIGVRAVGAADGTGSRIALGDVVVRNPDGSEVSRRATRETVPQGSCGEPVEDGYALGDCRELLVLPLEVRADGDYLVDVEAWRLDDEAGDAAFDAWLPGPFYRRGDTWYRDMLEPGLADARAPPDTDSLQWLARSMIADERFAEAAIKFWWPMVMGSDIVEPPAEGDPAFAARLSASNGHAEEVRRLANGFRNGFHRRQAYDLKDLLTEIVVSKWFRTASVPDSDPVRVGALATAGAKRLLTPEELSRKTQALAGFEWGRWIPQPGQAPENDDLGALSRPEEYALLYGGIDSNGVVERAREITSVMAGVAQSHAVESSCPIAMREFYLVDADRRRLFGGIDLDMPPDTEAGSRQVRDKLVDLYATLFGAETSSSSDEIRDAHAFFMDVQSRKTGGSFRESATPCDWATDQRFLDGIVDGAFGPMGDEGTYGWDLERVDRHFDSIDWSDPHAVARTWTVVLAYLLMDFRYLYL